MYTYCCLTMIDRCKSGLTWLTVGTPTSRFVKFYEVAPVLPLTVTTSVNPAVDTWKSY